MSPDMQKEISDFIRGMAATVLWVCAAVMVNQGIHPKHGAAGALLNAALIIGLAGVAFDVWRWFANRRAA